MVGLLFRRCCYLFTCSLGPASFTALHDLHYLREDLQRHSFLCRCCVVCFRQGATLVAFRTHIYRDRQEALSLRFVEWHSNAGPQRVCNRLFLGHASSTVAATAGRNPSIRLLSQPLLLLQQRLSSQNKTLRLFFHFQAARKRQRKRNAWHVTERESFLGPLEPAQPQALFFTTVSFADVPVRGCTAGQAGGRQR